MLSVTEKWPLGVPGSIFSISSVPIIWRGKGTIYTTFCSLKRLNLLAQQWRHLARIRYKWFTTLLKTYRPTFADTTQYAYYVCSKLMVSHETKRDKKFSYAEKRRVSYAFRCHSRSFEGIDFEVSEKRMWNYKLPYNNFGFIAENSEDTATESNFDQSTSVWSSVLRTGRRTDRLTDRNADDC